MVYLKKKKKIQVSVLRKTGGDGGNQVGFRLNWMETKLYCAESPPPAGSTASVYPGMHLWFSTNSKKTNLILQQNYNLT